MGIAAVGADVVRLAGAGVLLGPGELFEKTKYAPIATNIPSAASFFGSAPTPVNFGFIFRRPP
jgi:hypothetical protein